MKYLLLLTLLSCRPENQQNYPCLDEYCIDSSETHNAYSTFHLTIVDSCEYIYQGIGWDHAIFTHKGNCKFCQIRNKLSVYTLTNTQQK